MVTVDGEQEVGELEVSAEDLRRERLRAGLLRRLGGFLPSPNAHMSSMKKRGSVGTAGICICLSTLNALTPSFNRQRIRGTPWRQVGSHSQPPRAAQPACRGVGRFPGLLHIGGIWLCGGIGGPCGSIRCCCKGKTVSARSLHALFGWMECCCSRWCRSCMHPVCPSRVCFVFRRRAWHDTQL